ncbi:MAG: metal-dependent transcriptional regulator [Actinomycetia bacterium]|nr:metal-dependent transcriptional regulator [Actinomycetes bacterium]MCP4961451.1 metal-dependent transcriptional regulator [Actinomycetes bacterium]
MPDSTRGVYTSPEYHPAFEEYCETIFELREDGVEVIRARIAERLEVSRPAVSEMIKRMESEQLVLVEDGAVSLTEAGVALARTVVLRHRIAERFLTDVLGLSWADAHHEAGKWEHVISPKVEAALLTLLDNPTTCPHGNPIPGSEYTPPDQMPLVEVHVGARFVVSRIPEELEFRPGMLEFLEGAALVPGSAGVVTAQASDGTVTVEVEGSVIGVGAFASERILVTS